MYLRGEEIMYLKCTKCGKIHTLGVLICDCGCDDFKIITDDVEDFQQRVEDIKHTLSLLKEEINELIKTYIDPWLK